MKGYGTMILTRFILIIPLLIFAAASGLTAEDSSGISEEEIFSEDVFKETVEQGKAEEEKARLETIIGTDFIFSNTWIQQVNPSGYVFDSQFYGRALARASFPDIALLFISYNFAIPIYSFTSEPQVYTGIPVSEVSADLGEFFIGFDVKKKVFFRIGYQLVSWGPSYYWTPVDFINQERIRSEEEIEVRRGKPGAKIHLPVRDSNFFMFIEFSEAVSEEDTTDRVLERSRVGLRFDTVVKGYEIGLSNYFGKDLHTRWGLDWSGIFLRSDFYGELAASYGSDVPYAKETATGYELSYRDEPVFSISNGISKNFGDLKYWNIRGELYFNSEGYGTDAPYDFLVSQDLFSPLYMGKFYTYLAITKSNLFIEDIAGTLSATINLLDPSFENALLFRFSFPNLIPFNVRFSLYTGSKDGEFTYYYGDAFSVSVYTKLSI